MKGFDKAYKLLPPVVQLRVKSILSRECGWDSPLKWHRKKSGVYGLHVLEEKIIISEFKKYNVDAEKGTYINLSIVPKAILEAIEK